MHLSRSFRPYRATHWPDGLPFVSPFEEVGQAHPDWYAAMKQCQYPEESISARHHFTKSVSYYPDWQVRTIKKNEHLFDAAANKITTREIWEMQLHYGGPAREPWDQIVRADWDGGELDAVWEAEGVWITLVLRIIEQAICAASTETPFQFKCRMATLARAIHVYEDYENLIDFGGPWLGEESDDDDEETVGDTTETAAGDVEDKGIFDMESARSSNQAEESIAAVQASENFRCVCGTYDAAEEGVRAMICCVECLEDQAK